MAEQLEELRGADLPEEEKSSKRTKLHARLASWSPKGRKVSGISVVDDGGEVVEDPFGALRGHWEGVFNNFGGSACSVESLGGFVQTCPEGIQPLSFEEFSLLCSINRSSAPGPDGGFVLGLEGLWCRCF